MQMENKMNGNGCTEKNDTWIKKGKILNKHKKKLANYYERGVSEVL